MNFLQLINEKADLKAVTGHTRTASNYRSAARTLGRFLQTIGREALHVEHFTSVIAMQLENYLLNVRSVCPNTSSFYFRQLRAVYNAAVLEGLCIDNKPFRDVYKSVAATRKRAAEAQDLQHLFHLDLKLQPKLAFARDLFYFSFLGRGIPFVDLAQMKTQHIEGNHLIYQRSKTRQQVVVELVGAMHDIISRWRQPGSNYLFPILPPNYSQGDYDTALRCYNRRLSKLSSICHISQPLTSYIARHSWASEAYRLGVPITTISTCMGHTTELTTRIYLRSLSTRHIDDTTRAVVMAYT